MPANKNGRNQPRALVKSAIIKERQPAPAAPKQLAKTAVDAARIAVAEILRQKVLPAAATAAKQIATPLLNGGLNWAKSKIRSLMGSGKYTIGDKPKYNVLSNSSQVPRFGATDGKSIHVSHREYVMDVVSAVSNSSFSQVQHRINPANVDLFPWLSDVSTPYSQYKFHGLVFEYRSMSGDVAGTTNTALGSVVLAYSPDPLSPGFYSRAAMEQQEGAISVAPSDSAMFAVECANNTQNLNLYKLAPVFGSVNPSTYGQQLAPDREVCDFGTINIATDGCQGSSVKLGELWVTYTVELLVQKQNLGSNIGQYCAGWNATSGAVSLGIPIGDMTQASIADSIGVVFNPGLGGSTSTTQTGASWELVGTSVCPGKCYSFTYSSTGGTAMSNIFGLGLQYNDCQPIYYPLVPAITMDYGGTGTMLTNVIVVQGCFIVTGLNPWVSLTCSVAAAGNCFPAGTVDAAVIITQLNTELLQQTTPMWAPPTPSGL